jgi:DNA (cytosine-5)-methyltransferase 1
MNPAYYNEWDAYAAEWLRNLIAAGHIPAGDVDERDIRKVTADDLRGYGQVHLFAGIAGWPLALKLAGWDGPVWTCSCPCPPFSIAGRQKTCPQCSSRLLVWSPGQTGFAICADCGHEWLADARHLWPEAWRLVAECRPATVFGEQVAGQDGLRWLAGVRASMEILTYAFGGADLCAAGVAAPHIRQRLFWVAHAEGEEREQRIRVDAGHGGTDRRMDDATGARHEPEGRWQSAEQEGRRGLPSMGCEDGGLANADVRDAGSEGLQRSGEHGQQQKDGGSDGLGDTAQHQCPQQDNDRSQSRKSERQAGGSGFWGQYDLIPCADGKARRVEPGTFPLADGVPNRLGQLRAYGNAIVPQAAAEFIRAAMRA